MNGVDNYDKEECKSSCIASKFQNNTTPVYYISGCQDVFVSYAKRILLDGAILGFLAAFYHVSYINVTNGSIKLQLEIF